MEEATARSQLEPRLTPVLPEFGVFAERVVRDVEPVGGLDRDRLARSDSVEDRLDLARWCVISCLTDDAAVRDVYVGDDGVLQSASAKR
jgi:hypothetical protein